MRMWGEKMVESKQNEKKNDEQNVHGAEVDSAEGRIGSGEPTVEKLLVEVEEKQTLLEEMTNRYQRLQADFDNFRRRTRQEKEEISSVVAQDLILQILPVIDNLERALDGKSQQDAKAIVAGIEMIYRQMVNLLAKNGLEAIEAVGVMFNPEQHQAVIRAEDSEHPDGTILEELQKGYRVRDKVVRPSMVKVAGNN